MLNSSCIKEFHLKQKADFVIQTLGWLLNKNKNHNIKSTFLDDFMYLISEKVDTLEDIQVKTFYDIKEYGLIDILIETKNSIYAVKCANINDNDDIGNLFSYKDYFKENLKSDKNVTCVFISVAPCDFDEQTSKYIKCVGYYDIAEILPNNLESENQQTVDKLSYLLQLKSAKAINDNYSNDEINSWVELNKYGKIVRQLAKYFDLKFDNELFRPNFRRYSININKDSFILINCEKNKLDLVIRSNIDNALKTIKEVNISDIDTKLLDEIIETIKESSILEELKQQR